MKGYNAERVYHPWDEGMSVFSHVISDGVAQNDGNYALEKGERIRLISPIDLFFRKTPNTPRMWQYVLL